MSVASRSMALPPPLVEQQIYSASGLPPFGFSVPGRLQYSEVLPPNLPRYMRGNQWGKPESEISKPTSGPTPHFILWTDWHKPQTSPAAVTMSYWSSARHQDKPSPEEQRQESLDPVSTQSTSFSFDGTAGVSLVFPTGHTTALQHKDFQN